MRKTLLRFAFVVAVVLLPLGVHFAYQAFTGLPGEMIIASGPQGGRYAQVVASLAQQVEKRTGVQVQVVPTEGSLENLTLLDEAAVDFCLYQPQSEQFLHDPDAGTHVSAAFVANVYTEIVHFAVRRNLQVEWPDDLRGKRVSLGLQNSGDYAMSRRLLEHLGLDEESIDPAYLTYDEIKAGFADGSLDAAFLTLGVGAPILEELFAEGICDLVPVPFAEALAQRDVSISIETIPAGFYRSFPPVEPASDLLTVGLRAQLLTRKDVPSSLVEEVAEILLSEDFAKRNGLVELFTNGKEFARDKQEFPAHPGTLGVFEPGLRPLLSPEFVEATEGMRSFVVSLFIAALFGYRWLKKQHELRQEHRLDRYMRQALDIEQRQISLDAESGNNDIESLRGLLDEVTQLRHSALSEFSAHELNEDRAADCFLEMTHALSEKINAKLTRQRFDKRLDELSVQLASNAESSLEE